MQPLDAATQTQFEEMVNRDVDVVRSALATVRVSEPVFAICLHYTPDSSDLLDPGAVYIGVESDRRRALAAGTPVDVFSSIWNPMEYTGGEIVPEPSPREDPAFVETETRLVPSLRQGGVEEPGWFVLSEVARRLTADPPIEPVSEDYVAFVMDHGFSERLLETLRNSAPRETAADLRRRGLLPDDIDDLTRMA